MSTTAYKYLTAKGKLLFTVVRRDRKVFEIFDANGARLSQLPARTVLYRLPELVAANNQSIVYVCEGEKDTDRLASLGLVATTNPGGCRLGWKEVYSEYLRDRSVVILPDNDKPGNRHAEKVEMALLGVARRCAILKLPRLRRAGDVSDWLDYGKGTPAELRQRAEAVLSPGNLPKQGTRGHQTRHAIFLSGRTATEKVLLLAIVHCGMESPSAADLAALTSMHRVTVQRLIQKLQRAGLIRRTPNGLVVHEQI